MAVASFIGLSIAWTFIFVGRSGANERLVSSGCSCCGGAFGLVGVNEKVSIEEGRASERGVA